VPDAGAELWWEQAESDRRAARRVLNVDDPRTFCHAVAKQQQAVEKAVKALASALRDAGMASVRIKFTHGVDKLINVLKRLHRPNSVNSTVQGRLDRLLTPHWESEISAIMELAPHRPLEDQPVPRNTEYPYQNQDGSWRAPASAGSFADADVRRFQALADHIVTGAERLVAAIIRRP